MSLSFREVRRTCGKSVLRQRRDELNGPGVSRIFGWGSMKEGKMQGLRFRW